MFHTSTRCSTKIRTMPMTSLKIIIHQSRHLKLKSDSLNCPKHFLRRSSTPSKSWSSARKRGVCTTFRRENMIKITRLTPRKPFTLKTSCSQWKKLRAWSKASTTRMRRRKKTVVCLLIKIRAMARSISTELCLMEFTMRSTNWTLMHSINKSKMPSTTHKSNQWSMKTWLRAITCR